MPRPELPNDDLSLRTCSNVRTPTRVHYVTLGARPSESPASLTSTVDVPLVARWKRGFEKRGGTLTQLPFTDKGPHHTVSDDRLLWYEPLPCLVFLPYATRLLEPMLCARVIAGLDVQHTHGLCSLPLTRWPLQVSVVVKR